MSIRLLLLAAALAPAAFADVFRESLTLHPLPDGKLSVLFEFTTEFELPRESAGEFRDPIAPPRLARAQNVLTTSISPTSLPPLSRTTGAHSPPAAQQRFRAVHIVCRRAMGPVPHGPCGAAALWQWR